MEDRFRYDLGRPINEAATPPPVLPLISFSLLFLLAFLDFLSLFLLLLFLGGSPSSLPKFRSTFSKSWIESLLLLLPPPNILRLLRLRRKLSCLLMVWVSVFGFYKCSFVSGGICFWGDLFLLFCIRGCCSQTQATS